MECYLFSDTQIDMMCRAAVVITFWLLIWGLRKCLFIWPENTK